MERLIQKEVLELARQTIRMEAEALLKVESTLGVEFTHAVDTIIDSRGKVIMTGVGKSGIVARKIAATLASTGTPSFYLHPTEAFHGDLGMISKDDVVIAISYSGETDEVLKLVPFIHANGNDFITITGHEESTLAKHSDIHLYVGIDSEACILKLAPTTSTTVQMAMGDALAVALMHQRNFTSIDFARLHPGGSLGRRLLTTVGDVMRRDDLPIVSPDCSAKDMISAISRGGLGVIVVCDGGDVLGVVTDGDIRRTMESRESEFFNIVASDICSRSPKTIAESEKLIVAEKMMTKHKVSLLLATNAENQFSGIIQIYDIKL